jgi:hypothetical protein
MNDNQFPFQGNIVKIFVERYVHGLCTDFYFQCTEDSHNDKPELLNAVRTMMEVATYINEYKRRKDIGELKLDFST